MNQRALFLQHLAQTSDTPLMLEIERAEGIYLYDQQGKEYIDIIAGIGVSNVGHRHPKVTEAIHNQVDSHLHLMVFGEFVQSPQVKLAEALSNTLPDNLNCTYILNSGSEAVEGALKLAKRITGRRKLIGFTNAYHGSSHGALSMCGNEELKNKFRPLLPEVYSIEYDDLDALDFIDEETAAVIIEPVQGEAGVRIPSTDFMQALRAKCTQLGVMLIADEIQAGFGRTGTFWSFEHFDITPDIIVCAKGMGGGMPIGAFIASKEHMALFKNNPMLGHISTFGGHPVSCAASLATLEVIQEEKLLESVESKGLLFKSLLENVEGVEEIRQIGLMIAIKFKDYDTLKSIIDKGLELGIVSDWFLFCNDSMRIAPPLTITEEEITKSCELIKQAIEFNS